MPRECSKIPFILPEASCTQPISLLRPIRLRWVPGVFGNCALDNSSAKQRREITLEHPLLVSPEEHREFVGCICPDGAEFGDDLLHLPRRVSLPKVPDSLSKFSMVGKPSSMVGKPSSMVGKPSSMVGKPSSMVGKSSGMVGKPSSMVGKSSGMVGKSSGMVGKLSIPLTPSIASSFLFSEWSSRIDQQKSPC